MPACPGEKDPTAKPPPSKKRKKNGTTHSKLIEEFAQRSHVRNSVNLSSYHGKKQNIKTLCPYHDMLPVIQVMEKEVFNRAKGNSIKKEYCNMLPIIRNHCEWTCSGSPYKLECRNLLMKAKELYEYEFDLNEIALPFMNAVVLGGPNPNICIQLVPASATSQTSPPGHFSITFKPLQNLSLLERNETCNIALKAISCGTFKRNLQPVPDACRITKLLDGDGCFVTVDKGQSNPQTPGCGTQGSIFFKVGTCEVRQRRKLQGTDSVLGVGFDCASRLSWQKPRIYWMHQSIHTVRDKKSKKITEKKHISNRDLRFSILVPYDFRGSVVVFMIGIQDDKHYAINTSIACKRYSSTSGDGTGSGSDPTTTNFNGLNGYNPGLQSVPSSVPAAVSRIKNDQMLPPSSLSMSAEQPLPGEHSQDIALQMGFQASLSNNGQSPAANSPGSTNDTLPSNISNGCGIPTLPNITPSSVSIQPPLSLGNINSANRGNGEGQSANTSPNSKLNVLSNSIPTTTTTPTLCDSTNNLSNGTFPPPPTNGNGNVAAFSQTQPLFTGNNTVAPSDLPMNGGKLNLQAFNAPNGQFLATDNSQQPHVPPFNGSSIITASGPLSSYNTVTTPQAQSYIATLPMNTMSVNGVNPMNAINTVSVNGMGNPNGNLMHYQAPPSVIMNGVNSVNGMNGINGMGSALNGVHGIAGGHGAVGPTGMMAAEGQDSGQSLMQPPGAISVYSTVNNNTTINNTINNTMHSMAMATQRRDGGGRGSGGDKSMFGTAEHEDKGKFIDQDLENGRKTYIELLRSVNFRDERYQTLASKWIRTCIDRYSQNEDIYHSYLLNIVQSLISSIGDDKTVRGLKRSWMSYNNTENEWSFLHMICSKNLLYLFESMAKLLVHYKHELMVSMTTTPKESKLRISPLYCCVINSHHQFSKYLMDYFLRSLSSFDLARILQNGTPNEPSNSMVHHLITYGHDDTLRALHSNHASRKQEDRFLSPEQLQLIESHLQLRGGQRAGNREIDPMQMTFNNAFSK